MHKSKSLKVDLKLKTKIKYNVDNSQSLNPSDINPAIYTIADESYQINVGGMSQSQALRSKNNLTAKSYIHNPRQTKNKLPTLALKLTTEGYTESKSNNYSVFDNRSLTQRARQKSPTFNLNNKRSFSNQKTLDNIIGKHSPKQEELNMLFLKRRINNNQITNSDGVRNDSYEKQVIYKAYNQKEIKKIGAYLKDKEGTLQTSTSKLLNVTTDQKIFARLKNKIDEVHLLVSIKYSYKSLNFFFLTFFYLIDNLKCFEGC